VEGINLGVLFILGLGVLGGMLGAWFFQKLRIPQVVGYITIGVILGDSGLKMVGASDVAALGPFNLFALGIIGFLVGGELKISTFKKYGKQFVAILLGEGLGAFVLVGLFSALVLYAVTGNGTIAAASGVVFGAIASATDPASTIDVLWEYRGRGALTTTLTAIVALDDALAMTLYGLGTSTAQMLTQASGSVLTELRKVGVELLGAVALGFVFAWLLRFLVRWIHQPEKNLAFAIGLILLLISVAGYFGMDIILASMALGFGLVNMAPRASRDVFKIVRGFSVPIFVLFFVLVGARLGVSKMPSWLWGVVGLYVVGRSLGKMAGAWAGAGYAGSAPAVRRYLGLGLFAQGGVAVGLSITATQHLGGINVSEDLSLGEVIVFGITATTLIVQFLGPPMVKLSMKLAGEIGKNVTEDDVIDSLKVRDVMDRDVSPIREDTVLVEAVGRFTESDYEAFPVVSEDGSLIGILALRDMKELLADHDAWRWIVVSDLAEPIDYRVVPSRSLRETIDYMRKYRLEQVPVVEEKDGDRLVGVLDLSRAMKRVSDELLRRRHAASGSGGD